jgi:hypothetical protein
MTNHSMMRKRLLSKLTAFTIKIIPAQRAGIFNGIVVRIEGFGLMILDIESRI